MFVKSLILNGLHEFKVRASCQTRNVHVYFHIDIDIIIITQIVYVILTQNTFSPSSQ